jgi:hypothetical protein
MSQKWLKKLQTHHPILARRALELNKLDHWDVSKHQSKSNKVMTKKRSRDSKSDSIVETTSKKSKLV